MPKMTIEDYKTKIQSLELENKQLKFQLENFESIQRGKCCDCCEEAIQDYIGIKSKIEPFEDDYFKNLSYEQIAELAKKSIRITAENRKLEEKIDKITQENNLLKSDTDKIIEITKIFSKSLKEGLTNK